MTTLDEQIKYVESQMREWSDPGYHDHQEQTALASILATLRQVKAGQQAEPVAATIDIVELVLKHFGCDEWVQRYLLRAVWKDGIDIAKPTREVQAFADEYAEKVRLYATPQPAPGWVLRRSDVNEPQTESINELIARAKHAHYIDVRLRINGEYKFYEADWIKHLAATPAAPESK